MDTAVVDKTVLTTSDILNDRISPWYNEQVVPLPRILTDHDTEYKGKIENHAFQLFLSISAIVNKIIYII